MAKRDCQIWERWKLHYSTLYKIPSKTQVEPLRTSATLAREGGTGHYRLGWSGRVDSSAEYLLACTWPWFQHQYHARTHARTQECWLRKQHWSPNSRGQSELAWALWGEGRSTFSLADSHSPQVWCCALLLCCAQPLAGRGRQTVTSMRPAWAMYNFQHSNRLHRETVPKQTCNMSFTYITGRNSWLSYS